VWTQIGYRAYLGGRWNDAVTAYQQARELVERCGDEANVAVADSNLAEILLDQGRLVEAESALREAVRVWRAADSGNDAAFGSALLGRVLARQGRYDEAAELIASARTQFAEQGARTEVVDADTYEAERRLLSGAAGDALRLAEQALAAAGQLSAQPVQAPMLQRIIAGAHEVLGDADAAGTAYAKALDLARRRGADHDVAFTILAMARWSRRGGPPVEATLLAEASRLCSRLGLIVDITDDTGTMTPAREVPLQRRAAETAVSS
jgi:tetratricopeptide (TPR) repeat protein